MMKRSAGIIPYKIIDNKLYVYLERPGGPFCKNKNKWSVVKGEYTTEKAIEAARREFLEESGYSITNIKELVRIDCYWLAASKYPMLSRANIFEVSVDLNTKKEALENDCYVEWVDIDSVSDLLPLPYHKKALEYYTGR